MRGLVFRGRGNEGAVVEELLPDLEEHLLDARGVDVDVTGRFFRRRGPTIVHSPVVGDGAPGDILVVGAPGVVWVGGAWGSDGTVAVASWWVQESGDLGVGGEVLRGMG